MSDLDRYILGKNGRCPECGKTGKQVRPVTVSIFVRDAELYLKPEKIVGKFWLCENKKCKTVYFSDGGLRFSKQEIRTRVWQKEDDPDVPVCYCFKHSVASIREEIANTGKTEVLARIKSEVKNGNCRCEVTNPQGSCCLGNVVKAIEIAKNLIL